MKFGHPATDVRFFFVPGAVVTFLGVVEGGGGLRAENGYLFLRGMLSLNCAPKFGHKLLSYEE